MDLQSLTYSQFLGGPQEWQLQGLALGKVNLIVGRNASGKTKTLNLIANLAKLLTGQTKLTYHSGDYDIRFSNNGNTLIYQVKYESAKVLHEKFICNNESRLTRSQGGKGEIFAKAESRNIRFQTPENELAVVARRDDIQHPFLQPLHDWGKGVHHYLFGEKLGQDRMVAFTKDSIEEAALGDTNNVVAIYRKGDADFPGGFKSAIIRDMGKVFYPLDDLGIAAPISLTVSSPMPFVVLYVQEKGLPAKVDQLDMSQGMFRALSVIIQLNYLQLTGHSGCILIDDIGEGLDFERSCAFIKLIVAKAEETSAQLVMTSNDRFVMNVVPLKFWSVINRKGPICQVLNYQNSREVFDRFAFTGLSNFDFFATDFIVDEAAPDE